MVLSDTLLLRLVVPKNSRSTAYASFDGKGRIELRRGDEVRVEAGRYPFPTVVDEGGGGEEWFESVRRALRWNTRGVVQAGWGSRVAHPSRSGGVVESGVADTWSQEGKGVEEGDGEDDEDDGERGEEAEEEEEEEWDINADPIEVGAGTSTPSYGLDSGIGGSVHGGGGGGGGESGQVSPLKKGTVGSAEEEEGWLEREAEGLD